MPTLNLDLSQIQPLEGFSGEPLPNGNYTCVATDSQMRVTKAGTGKYLEVTFDVIEGAHKGRKLWSRFNIENPSERARTIGLGQLKQLGEAVGVPHIKESEQLHGKPVTLRVVVRRDPNFGPSNEVKGYMPAVAASPAASAPAPASAAPWDKTGDPSADAAPPWAR